MAMSKIRPLGFEDLPKVRSYLKEYPAQVSEQTFTNLFAWRKARPMFIVETNTALILLIKAAGANDDSIDDSMLVFGPPIGQGHPLDLVNSLDIPLRGFVRVPTATAEALRDAGLDVHADRDNSDYVYLVSDLAGLTGRRFSKKRNLVKQCLTGHKCEYEPISPSLIDECQKMQSHWCHLRDCIRDPDLCAEDAAIKDVFAHYEELGLIGGAVRVDGVIEAFAIGEELSPGVAVCHFEKANFQIRGLSQLVNHWFAKNALQGFEFVNREQDLGGWGLRQAKESYFPHHMVDKFVAWMLPQR